MTPFLFFHFYMTQTIANVQYFLDKNALGSFDPVCLRGRRLLMKYNFLSFSGWFINTDLWRPGGSLSGGGGRTVFPFVPPLGLRGWLPLPKVTVLWYSCVMPVFFLWTFAKIPKQHTVLGMPLQCCSRDFIYLLPVLKTSTANKRRTSIKRQGPD